MAGARRNPRHNPRRNQSVADASERKGKRRPTTRSRPGRAIFSVVGPSPCLSRPILPMLDLDRILFPTDFSETARHALPYAAYLAARHDAALTILHVQPPGDEGGADPDAELDICQETASRQFDVDLGDLDGTRIEREVRSGASVDDVVVEEAQAQKTDLIVMGTARRHGLASLFPQSTAVRVVRRAPCSGG